MFSFMAISVYKCACLITQAEEEGWIMDFSFCSFKMFHFKISLSLVLGNVNVNVTFGQGKIFLFPKIFRIIRARCAT